MTEKYILKKVFLVYNFLKNIHTSNRIKVQSIDIPHNDPHIYNQIKSKKWSFFRINTSTLLSWIVKFPMELKCFCVCLGLRRERKKKFKTKEIEWRSDGGRRRSLLLPISIRRNKKKQQPKQNGSRKGGIVLLFSLVEKRNDDDRRRRSIRKYVWGERRNWLVYTLAHTLTQTHTHYFVAWGEFERSAEREREIYII